jgi:hypothetical protein
MACKTELALEPAAAFREPLAVLSPGFSNGRRPDRGDRDRISSGGMPACGPRQVASGNANSSAEGAAWVSRNLGQATAEAAVDVPAVKDAHAVVAPVP